MNESDKLLNLWKITGWERFLTAAMRAKVKELGIEDILR